MSMLDLRGLQVDTIEMSDHDNEGKEQRQIVDLGSVGSRGLSGWR
jgi:hypothetical protein